MSDKNTDDKELSMDELKDVSGGGMGLDRLGTQKTTGKKQSQDTSIYRDNTLEAWEDGDGEDRVVSLCTDNPKLPKGQKAELVALLRNADKK